MRIALVSRELAPYWGGGIGTYAAEMAAAWARAGHDTHVLTPARDGMPERTADGVHLHGMRVADGEGRDFQRHAALVLEWLARLHAAAPFDAVEFPDYWAEGHAAIGAARAGAALGGAALIVRLHTPTFEARAFNAEAPDSAELDALMRAEADAIRRADVLVSPTRSLLDIVRRRLRLGAAPHSAVVPYPFEAGVFAALADAPEGGEPAAGPPTVLYFGRLERRKGVEVLLAAAQRLLAEGVGARFRLIGGDTATGPGGGSMLAYLRSLVHARRASILFEPALPRPALARAIRAAGESGGCCCFPSLWENFPNACVEAMAAGAPVIGSDAGGMAEIIDDGVSGLLFRSGDPEALAAAIRRVLGDASLRERLGRAAPARIRAICDPPAIVAGTAALIRAVRSRGRGAPAGAAP